MSSPIRDEHPRPDRVRDSWMTLNGQWDFAFDWESKGCAERWYEPDVGLRGERHKIEVPFPYQSQLSGINSQEYCQVVWYSRSFALPQSMENRRRLLRFGAADHLPAGIPRLLDYGRACGLRE